MFLTRKPRNPWFSLVPGLLLAWSAGCVQDPPERVRQKLEALARDDLQYIVQEVQALDSTQVAARPRYAVVEYTPVPRSDPYSVKAVVEFYYFKDIQIKQVRKYRYQFRALQWERYDKQLKNIFSAPAAADTALPARRLKR